MDAQTAKSKRAAPYLVPGTNTFEPYVPILFSEVNKQALTLAYLIEEHYDTVIDVLLEYESFEVAEDEMARTLDLLQHLEENESYFRLRVGNIASFLPKNQPLYAFACFVLIPSLLAHRVQFRIPHGTRSFFPRLLELLRINELFSNVVVSPKTRLEFLRECSALRTNRNTGESRPVTDAVIFTGTSAHADQLRCAFDNRTLFIANGSGHNPVIVTADADVPRAVEAVLTLQLYNQGQDCAAPNSILVHSDIYPKFLEMLRTELKCICIGPYRNRQNRVGPISEPEDLVRIQEILVHNRMYIDPATPGIVKAAQAIVEPTLICKPLEEGGNYTESFAPLIFVQEYTEDAELARYFENPHYARNAMYVTVYGTSSYAESLTQRELGDSILHDKASLLFNTHLHAPGIERGTQPYGGRGYGASSIAIDGNVIPRATLPQRDIYENLVRPILEGETPQRDGEEFEHVEEKNVEKILRMQKATVKTPPADDDRIRYVDKHALQKSKGQRYIELPELHCVALLERPNIEYAATLTEHDSEMLQKLVELLRERASLSPEEFTQKLYALGSHAQRGEELRANQLRLFRHIYQLLLGADSGPHLPSFLFDIDVKKAEKLLDI